jgi:hypothetical protein
MPLSTKRPSAKERLLDEVRETGGRVKRLNIDMDADLYRRMKRQAVEEDRTLSEITRVLWNEYLRKHAPE